VAKSADKAEERSYDARVLVVEDDPVNQRVIRLVLERIGLTIELAENGEIGFNQAISESWDLIFMDCHMPVLDGLAATKKIREYETKHGLSHTPIVAMTANAMESDREACEEAGMDDFLSKPVRKTALADVLDTWLNEPSRV
jgi:CheY-like chemotaxis protein